MKLYRVSKYDLNIKEIEATRKTESSFWYIMHSKERRGLLVTDYEVYFDTWEEARQHLIEREKSRIERLEHDLFVAKTRLSKAESMTIV